tara:strand:+ start:4466 stop:5305 length:840 start_codon:yes stop_codon:yes gene_type:complete
LLYKIQTWSNISWSLLCFVFTTVVFSPSVYAEKITIGGTGGALGTMTLMAQAYHKLNPEIKVIVLPSIGSSGGIKAISNAAIDIGLSSRPLKKSESITGIKSVEYARSLTIIAVSSQSNIYDISINQLVDIYTGKLLNWPDGMLIRPILRQPGDDNTKQLKALSPSLKVAVEIADNRPGLLFAATDQETVDKIEKTPGSFGVTSLALIISENRPLRALTLDGVAATPDAISSGLYPMVNHFYLILPVVIEPHILDFITFIKSADGAAILVQNGHSIAHK